MKIHQIVSMVSPLVHACILVVILYAKVSDAGMGVPYSRLANNFPPSKESIELAES